MAQIRFALLVIVAVSAAAMPAKAWKNESDILPVFLARKTLTALSYFDRTSSNFFAPAGGCTLPERMSFASTGLP